MRNKESRHPRDLRVRTLVAVGLIVLLGGLGLHWLWQYSSDDGALSPFARLQAPQSPASSALEQLQMPALPVDPTWPPEAAKVLTAAAQDIQNKAYPSAMHRLHSERETVKPIAQSYVLMGQALEGMGQMELARDFYGTALNKDPRLEQASWGFATTSEALGDLQAAVGAMRNFLHTTQRPDPDRLMVAQARSAIWEWEAKLGRGPWGPTRGVPPDFHPDELKRDGGGVGIKVPDVSRQKPDGSYPYEIKAQSKFKMHKTEADMAAPPNGAASR